MTDVLSLERPDRTHELECDCAFQDDAEYPNIGRGLVAKTTASAASGTERFRCVHG